MIYALAPLYLQTLRDTPDLIRRIAESGRVVEIGTPLAERVSPGPQIAPGASPLLSFRLYAGRACNRYASLDLVIDDAGH